MRNSTCVCFRDRSYWSRCWWCAGIFNTVALQQWSRGTWGRHAGIYMKIFLLPSALRHFPVYSIPRCKIHRTDRTPLAAGVATLLERVLKSKMWKKFGRFSFQNRRLQIIGTDGKHEDWRICVSHLNRNIKKTAGGYYHGSLEDDMETEACSRCHRLHCGLAVVTLLSCSGLLQHRLCEGQSAREKIAPACSSSMLISCRGTPLCNSRIARQRSWKL